MTRGDLESPYGSNFAFEDSLYGSNFAFEDSLYGSNSAAAQ